jgi:threonine dehydrogenase-like Zn-dependent dehydrogenase
MAAGAFTNNGLVTHTASLENAEAVYAAGLDKRDGYIKGVIDFTK